MERMDLTEETLMEPILQDDMDAEDHLRKIHYWESYEKQMIDHFKGQIEAVKAKSKSHIDYHMHLLRAYFSTVPHHSTKTQESYELPSGKLVMSKETDKLVKPEKDDEKQFLLYLTEEGIKGYTKTKVEEHLDWINYKKRLTIVDGKAVDKETGEVVDIKVEHVEPKFDYSLNEKETIENGTENQVA